jgi:hypothetical protein
MSAGENTQYSTNEILVFVLKYKWRYFFLLATIFITSLFFLRYRVLTYSSTATVNVFYGVKNEVKSERNLPDYLLPTDQLSAVMNAISSAAMEEHLIKKFRLNEHYGIDTTHEFYQGQVVKKLRASISLKKTPYNTIDITVNDPYRYVAYEIANEIASYADTINRRFILKYQTNRVAIRKSALLALEKALSKKERELNNLVDSLPVLKNSATTLAVNSLNEKIVSLGTAVENYAQTLKDEIIVLETFSQANLPTIQIQQRAIPDGQSLLVPSAIYSFLIVILSSIIIITYHYFRIRFREQLKIIRSLGNEK